MKSRVFMVMGLPGTGKTYVADLLANKLGALHLSSDRIRRELFPRRSYDPAEKAAVYDEMAVRLQTALAARLDVVLDATFYKAALRERFIRIAQDAGVPVQLVQTCASEAALRERLARQRPESEADFAVYEAIKARYEAPEEPILQIWTDQGKTVEAIQQLLEDGES